MATEMKTKLTGASVDDFINGIADENVRIDSRKIVELMSKATDAEPKMWGSAIVGFGSRLLKYASGRELDWMVIGFSPRKQNLTLYLSSGKAWNEDLLSKLGKHKTGTGCLYVKRLSDVDESVLNELIEESVKRGK